MRPPRWRQGRSTKGWTPSTINGQPKLAFGILNNPIYIGRLTWNRAQKVRDPETGKRVWRLRPADDWISMDLPELRIISDDLWNAVQARRATLRKHRPSHTGRRPTHLLSGLLVCGECGSSYVLTGGRGWYRCAGFVDRGPTVCTNDLAARRDVVEDKILALVQKEILAPESVELFVKGVTEEFSQLVREESQPKDRSALRRAERDLEHIKRSIRMGIITETEKAMLIETEAKIKELRAEPARPVRELRVTPAQIKSFLTHIRELVSLDLANARAALEDILGTIVLKPERGVLIATVQGDLAGAFSVGTGPRLGGKGGAGGPAHSFPPRKPLTYRIPVGQQPKRKVMAR